MDLKIPENVFRIEVPGPPVPWARARINPRSRSMQHALFKPERVRKQQQFIVAMAREAGVRKAEGPVSLHIRCYMKQPAKKPALAWPLKKPDVDNFAKTVLDALNQVAYKDDSQVISVLVSKHWAPVNNIGSTHITVIIHDR